MDYILQKQLLEFIKYCIVGGITFFVDAGILMLFTEWLGVNYFYAAMASFTIAVILNYWLCVLFVFQQGKINRMQAQLFLLVSIVGLGLNQLCMWFFVELINMNYLLAKIFATAMVTIWNYWMKRKAIST